MPRVAITWLVAALLLGAIVGFGFAYHLGSKQVKSLQHYSDSVTTISVRRANDAMAEAQRLRDSAAALRTRRVIIRDAADSTRARADAAERQLADVQTAADSVPILVTMVADLRISNIQLRAALDLADDEAATLRARGDTLGTALRDQTAEMERLNRRIAAMTPAPPVLPKWARTTLTAAKYAAVFYAGIQVERQVLHSGN